MKSVMGSLGESTEHQEEESQKPGGLIMSEIRRNKRASPHGIFFSMRKKNVMRSVSQRRPDR